LAAALWLTYSTVFPVSIFVTNTALEHAAAAAAAAVPAARALEHRSLERRKIKLFIFFFKKELFRKLASLASSIAGSCQVACWASLIFLFKLINLIYLNF
jgi:hypothetical protein